MRVVSGLIVLVALAAPAAPASADEWCGFHDKNHALVRCGYSSIQQCTEALGKDAVCIPDPTSAAIEPRRHAG
jgi:hypothetical protein